MNKDLFQNRKELLVSIANGTVKASEGIKFLNKLKRSSAAPLNQKDSSSDNDSSNNIDEFSWFQLRVLS